MKRLTRVLLVMLGVGIAAWMSNCIGWYRYFAGGIRREMETGQFRRMVQANPSLLDSEARRLYSLLAANKEQHSQCVLLEDLDFASQFPFLLSYKPGIRLVKGALEITLMSGHTFAALYWYPTAEDRLKSGLSERDDIIVVGEHAIWLRI